MKITLFLAILSIESSYLKNIDRIASHDNDTLQWIITDDGAWRVRTFAIDGDMHITTLSGAILSDSEWTDLIEANNRKHYGDVTERSFVLRSESGVEGILAQLAANGLDQNLEGDGTGFVFWARAGTRYSSKSKPDLPGK